MNKFRNNVKPNWCPGCGHYGTHNALQQALEQLGLLPEEVALISGIGCSGRIPGYMYNYGVHTTHGRALPFAQGVKLANPELTVVACSGDGDAFAIGAGHAVHALKRNINLTYIVMDNHVYGLTKGQTSPRSDIGFKTKTTPHGNTEQPISALNLAFTADAGFIAQGYSAQGAQLVELIKAAIQYEGFSFVNIFTPCVTFNKLNSYDWYKEHLSDISQIADYNPEDKAKAQHIANQYQGLLTGLIYHNPNKQSFEKLTGLAKNNNIGKVEKIAEDKLNLLLKEFI